MTFFIYALVLVQIILGIILCFFGYRYLRRIIIIYGALAGGLITYLLLSMFTGLSTLASIMISIVVGLGIGFLTYFFFVVGIFFTGAGFGFMLSVLLLSALGVNTDGTLSIVIQVLAAISCGALTVVYKRILLVISTAFQGAAGLSLYGGALLFSKLADQTFAGNFISAVARLRTCIDQFAAKNVLLLLASTLVLCIAGLLVQFVKTAPKK